MEKLRNVAHARSQDLQVLMDRCFSHHPNSHPSCADAQPVWLCPCPPTHSVKNASLSHRSNHAPSNPSPHGRRDHVPALAHQFLFCLGFDRIFRREPAAASHFLLIEHAVSAFLNIEGARVRWEDDPTAFLRGKGTEVLITGYN